MNIDEVIRGVKKQIAESPMPKYMYWFWRNEPRKHLNYKIYKGRGRPKETDYVMTGDFDYLSGYVSGEYSKNGDTRNTK